jgi:hypothetical protein
LRNNYCRTQRRKISSAEIAFLRKYFGNLTLQINRQANVWKFNSGHTHTIRLVHPKVKTKYKIHPCQRIDMIGGPFFVAVGIGKFRNVVEFEITRLDCKRLAVWPH